MLQQPAGRVEQQFVLLNQPPRHRTAPLADVAPENGVGEIGDYLLDFQSSECLVSMMQVFPPRQPPLPTKVVISDGPSKSGRRFSWKPAARRRPGAAACGAWFRRPTAGSRAWVSSHPGRPARAAAAGGRRARRPRLRIPCRALPRASAPRIRSRCRPRCRPFRPVEAAPAGLSAALHRAPSATRSAAGRTFQEAAPKHRGTQWIRGPDCRVPWPSRPGRCHRRRPAPPCIRPPARPLPHGSAERAARLRRRRTGANSSDTAAPRPAGLQAARPEPKANNPPAAPACGPSPNGGRGRHRPNRTAPASGPGTPRPGCRRPPRSQRPAAGNSPAQCGPARRRVRASPPGRTCGWAPEHRPPART